MIQMNTCISGMTGILKNVKQMAKRFSGHEVTAGVRGIGAGAGGDAGRLSGSR